MKIKRKEEKEKENKTRIKFESHCTLKLINFLSTLLCHTTTIIVK